MGHLTAKDAFDRLGERLDRMEIRVPQEKALRAILTELYTAEEADLVVQMPSTPALARDLQRATGYPEARLAALLESLATKGLVIDLWSERDAAFRYTPSPYVIGIFEFTMMRHGADADHARRARLFGEYMAGFMAGNFSQGERVSVARAVPHEDALTEGRVEVLDFERASSIVEGAKTFAVGICSCRHEMHHVREESGSSVRCSAPLESCTSFDVAADYLVRRGLARFISRQEMRDILVRSRELGLVMNVDNVRKGMKFMCHCCGCCCNLLRGISEFGYPNVVVTASVVAGIEGSSCNGCRRCVRACPIQAIVCDKGQPARVTDTCLGCGVCVPACSRKALTLRKRSRRVLHPATTFERVILQALERGTLQNFIFDGPSSGTREFLRGVVGGFLRLGTVKRALMSDRLRSLFLASLTRAAGPHSAAF